jgi:ubiquinone/menaquinone biosynthesis C-methylase UbiE
LENLAAGSGEVSRVLKPNGEILIITANPDRYEAWESLYEDYTKEGKKLAGKVNIPGSIQISRNVMYQHTLKEITDALEQAGISVTSVVTFGRTKGNENERLFIAIDGKKNN